MKWPKYDSKWRKSTNYLIYTTKWPIIEWYPCSRETDSDVLHHFISNLRTLLVTICILFEYFLVLPACVTSYLYITFPHTTCMCYFIPVHHIHINLYIIFPHTTLMCYFIPVHHIPSYYPHVLLHTCTSHSLILPACVTSYLYIIFPHTTLMCYFIPVHHILKIWDIYFYHWEAA